MTPRQKEPEQQELLPIPEEVAEEIEEYERYMDELMENGDEPF